MNKLISGFLPVLLFASAASAQVDFDRSINLTGTAGNAKVSGIKQVSAAQDAVSVEVLQKGLLVYAASTNTGNAYSVTLTPAVTAYSAGLVVNFRASAANTGAATLNVNGLGAVAIKKSVTADLATNDILNNQLISVIHDGANFQLLAGAPLAGSSNYIQNNTTDGNLAVGQNASFDITGSAEIGGALKISGNTGIGTVNPATRLDLALAQNNKPLIHFNPGSTTGVDYAGFAHNDVLIGSYISGSYPQTYISFGYNGDSNRKLHIGSASNATFDGTTSFSAALTVNSGKQVGINTPSPTANLEVTGTVKMFGAWQMLSQNTIYQAATDGFVVTWGGSCYYNIATDGNTTPTTVVMEAEGNTANAARPNATVPVRKGDYWRVNRISGTGNVTVRWLPLGQ